LPDAKFLLVFVRRFSVTGSMLGALSIAQIATFGGIWLAAAAAPGANSAFTVSISSRYGLLAGLVAAAGFVSALLFYMALISYGLGFAVSQYGPLLNIVRWIGVAYLLYLAWRMWGASGAAEFDGEFTAFSISRVYAQGALICLTNPKAIIFITVVFPQTVNANAPLLPQLLILGLTGAIISFLVHTVYSTLGHMLGKSVPTLRARVIVNRMIAAVFVVAAVGLGAANI
jgi:homoserine/homoserine lactone efflux protein